MPAITNLAELQAISGDLAGDYWLSSDIDASGAGFVPIAGFFTGTLDGRGYDIDDLTITVNGAGYQYGALFQSISSGTVKNLGIVDCVISVTSTNSYADAAVIAISNYENVLNCHVSGTITLNGNGAGTCDAGGIVANNFETIDRCKSSVDITLNVNHANCVGTAGAFVRWNGSDGVISESYADGDVTLGIVGAGYRLLAGAFAYYNDSGLINDCYARGDASAVGGSDYNYAAGFIVTNAGTVQNSYSTGAPTAVEGIGGFCYSNGDTITDCFWDTQTSGTAVSDGGTGKTTAEMKSQSTFTNWDFVTIWGILSTINDGYPFFYALEELPDSPRRTDPVEDKITLESIRNLEMVAMGRFRVDKEGNAVYRSRYARNA